MSYRRYELDMSHSRAANLRACDLDAAFLALPAFVAHLFIFAADTLIIPHGAENFSAKQAVALRFERAVVDSLGLFYLAVAPSLDLLGTRNRNGKCVEVMDSGVLFDLYSF